MYENNEESSYIIILVIIISIIVILLIILFTVKKVHNVINENPNVIVFENQQNNQRPHDLNQQFIQSQINNNQVPQVTNNQVPQVNNNQVSQNTQVSNNQVPQINNIKKPDEYYNRLEKHDYDSQNSHDHVVVICLNNKYKKLMDYEMHNIKEILSANINFEEVQQIKINEALRQINDYLNTLQSNIKIKINKVLKSIRPDSIVTSIHYNNPDLKVEGNGTIKEQWILTLIWNRINHPDNINKIDLLKQSFVDQMVDCLENYGNLRINAQTQSPIVNTFINMYTNRFVNDISNRKHVVCAGGRLSRLFSILVLLDNDPILSEPIKDTYEMTNLLYSKAHNILQTELNNFNIKTLYETTDINDVNIPLEDKQRLIEFEKHVKNKIDIVLTNEYKQYFNEKKLKFLIKKAQDGV